VGAVANIQAGGNSNYFFEGLFALTPLATLGALRLTRRRQQSQPAANLLAAGLLVSTVVLPSLLATAYSAKHNLTSASRAAERRPIELLSLALPGHRVLAMPPRVAILTSEPLLIEPYVLAYWQLAGQFDTQPIRDRIRRQDFEAVVSDVALDYWRGVPRMPPDLWKAIGESYQPFCAAGPRWVVHMPRGRPGGVLEAKLTALGCSPLGR
jgi:hypothetical protein